MTEISILSFSYNSNIEILNKFSLLIIEKIQLHVKDFYKNIVYNEYNENKDKNELITIYKNPYVLLLKMVILMLSRMREINSFIERNGFNNFEDIGNKLCEYKYLVYDLEEEVNKLKKRNKEYYNENSLLKKELNNYYNNKIIIDKGINTEPFDELNPDIDKYVYDSSKDDVYHYFNEFNIYIETQKNTFDIFNSKNIINPKQIPSKMKGNNKYSIIFKRAINKIKIINFFKKTIEHNKYKYVKDIIDYGFNNNTLYEIVNDIKDKSYFYEKIKEADKIIKKNKHVAKNNKKTNRKKKPKTEEEKEEILHKTINNILSNNYLNNQNSSEDNKESIYKLLLYNNKTMIKRYLDYYNLYINKNINKDEYKDILSNYENHNDTNFSRHLTICSIFKEMDELHLFDTNIIYKYWTFQYITKDKVKRFVYLLNERILKEEEKNNIYFNNIESDDTEIREDYNNIMENIYDSEWETEDTESSEEEK